MIRKSIALLVSTSLLSACSYGFRGPHPVVNASGPVLDDHSGQQRYGMFFERFRALALRAADCAEVATAPTNSTGLAVDCNESAQANPELLRRYMRAGFALIYADCDQYLAMMARNQGRSRIARDLVTPITNLVTGILAISNLADGDRQDALRVFNLGSSGASAGLDIIDQRFLFGGDNIDIVRGRVTTSLGEHGDRALQRPDAELNFERASSEILNNQALCTPSGILRLTRNAIQAAPTRTSNSSDAKAEGGATGARSGTSATTVDP